MSHQMVYDYLDLMEKRLDEGFFLDITLTSGQCIRGSCYRPNPNKDYMRLDVGGDRLPVFIMFRDISTVECDLDDWRKAMSDES